MQINQNELPLIEAIFLAIREEHPKQQDSNMILTRSIQPILLTI
jgi:hypothetical protein